MKFVQAMGLLVLIALGMPAPKLPAKWIERIRRSEGLAAKVEEIEGRSARLEGLPVVPMEELRAGEERVVCDEVPVARGYVPVCVSEDAVYLTMEPGL